MELIQGKVGDFIEPIQGKGDSLWSLSRGRGTVYGDNPSRGGGDFIEQIQEKRYCLRSPSRGRGIVYRADPGEAGLFMEPI